MSCLEASCNASWGSMRPSVKTSMRSESRSALAPALASLDRQAHVEVPSIGDARYVRLGIHDLHVGLELYVGRRNGARAVFRDRELYGLLPLELELQALDVEDNVYDVLFDAFDRRELVRDALYADLGDRSPREP